MKNKKGFTLIELLSVIVILGLISSIALISVTKRKKEANDKEKIILRQNIISGFEIYRLDNAVSKGKKISIKDLLFEDGLSYNNKRCTDLEESNDNKVWYTTKSDSKEEYFCIVFLCNGETVIDDRNKNECN